MDPIVLPDSKRRWDCLSLGEVMLRLDPGQGRIHATRTFHVWDGGGEYSGASGPRRCLGLRTAIATALADVLHIENFSLCNRSLFQPFSFWS
jgi:2-dehydro-3-deoxygluconokinase